MGRSRAEAHCATRYTAKVQPEQIIINSWKGAAPYWEKHREIIRQMFAPVTDALVEEARIGGGQTVLDIAAGPGEPALSIAALVGSTGKVFGVDPVPEMVAAARRASDQLGLSNAQFDLAFADHLPFPGDTFGAVVSRFGVMFFPSPADAVREMLRVLKPGGILALAAWHYAQRNPYFDAVKQILDQYADSPAPAPDSADAFRFASPGKLRDILSDAGAVAPTERLLQFKIQAPISLEEFWTLRCELSETLREKLATLSGEQVAEVKRRSLEAVRQYSSDRGMSFPAEVLIVSGTKSL